MQSWNLFLNTGKYVAVKYGGEISDVLSNFCNIDGKFLKMVTVHRDLGIKVDSRLRFHEHVREVVQKAGGLAEDLLHSIVCRSTESMVSLFISHIIPILDFSSIVWRVGYLGDVRLFESVQKRWTREIVGVGHLSYVERLKVLVLYSVHSRVIRADLIKCWKVFHSEGGIGFLIFFCDGC